MQDLALAEHLGAGARQQLDTLRRALDERLTSLETALSGSRGAAPLETLLLDLARVATDEAQSATALACFDVKRESDAALQQLEERHAAALAAERARTTDLERALQETRGRLDAHVAASRQSSEAQARAEERAAAFSKEHAEAVARSEELRAELAHVRAELARVQAGATEYERACRELQQRLEAHEATKADEEAARHAEQDEMKKVLASVKGVFMKFGQQKIAIDERFRNLEAELERTRDALRRSEARIRP